MKTDCKTVHSPFLSLGLSLLLCCVAPRANAAFIRHALTSSDSVATAQTQGACETYTNGDGRHWCNFGLFPKNTEREFRADILLRADETEARSTQNVAARKVTKDQVEKLFSDRSFRSYSTLARIEGQNDYFTLSYVPLHLIGAYEVTNPSLPEINLSGVQEEVFRLGSGITLPTLWPDFYQFSVGTSVYRFQRKFYYLEANSLELLVRPFDELLDTEVEAGWDASVGVAAQSQIKWLPSVGLRVDDLFRPEENADNERLLAIKPYFRRRSSIGFSYALENEFGRYHLGLSLPFTGTYSHFRNLDSVLSFIYGIGNLQAFVSYSGYMSSFGFHFKASYYQVGIQYTDEKQDNALELARQKNVYLFGTIFI